MTCRPSPSSSPRPGAPRRSSPATARAGPREAAMAHPSPADPLEAAFAAALLDRGAPVPAGVLATPRRFAVYRDNVAAALTAALAARFPLLRRIVGDAFFRALALDHAK